MNYSTKLISNLRDVFEKKFDLVPKFIFSPGRINLIGEHTDYNEGYVMPAAIDKGIYIAFEKNDLKLLRLHSYDYDETIEVSLDDLKTVPSVWANYILGVVFEVQKLAPLEFGFDMVFGGDIPIGAGLSSSAALECGVGVMLNHIFDLELDDMTMAKIGQMAEHHFVGVRCGIMDQFASISGKKDHVLKLDCRSLDFQYFKVAFGEYKIVLCNSKVKHALAESSYNKRREECEFGIEILKREFSQVKSLRDMTIEMLDTKKQELSATIYNRCSYVIEENLRVLEASRRLRNKELKELGMLLFESHEGLSEKYDVSCEELDFLVALTKEHPAVIGSRMMGGGFGGCTINLIQIDELEVVIKYLEQHYHKEYKIELECFDIELVDGTHIINTN